MNRHRIEVLDPGIGIVNILDLSVESVQDCCGFSCRDGGLKKRIPMCSCELGHFLRRMWPRCVPALEETKVWRENYCFTRVVVFIEGGFPGPCHCVGFCRVC